MWFWWPIWFDWWFPPSPPTHDVIAVDFSRKRVIERLASLGRRPWPFSPTPSFTVEVKRSNKRVPLTAATADSALSERDRLADQLLFRVLSAPAAPGHRWSC